MLEKRSGRDMTDEDSLEAVRFRRQGDLEKKEDEKSGNESQIIESHDADSAEHGVSQGLHGDGEDDGGLGEVEDGGG